jgi:hypothetical protein
MILLHTSNPHTNEPLVRLNMDMELALFQGPWEGTLKRKSHYASRKPYRANTGRAGHIEQRPMQEDLFVQEGEYSFLMKEDLERREVAGVELDEPLHDYFCAQCLPGRDSYAEITIERTVGRESRE